MRPGLTRVAQVNEPLDLARRHKFTFGLPSIVKQTFWLDLKLITLYLWITVRGKWESRGKKF